MSRIGFIGTGHIAAPMVRFLAAKGHEIAVTRRNEAVSAGLRASHGVTVAEAQAVVDASEIVFLCVRPAVAEAAIAPLAFRPDQRIVSVMASVSAADLARLTAPAASIVQTIPLGFLEQGGCPLVAFGDAQLLASLFEPENPVIPVGSEAEFNAHVPICTLVPGILDLMATASDWLAGTGVDPDKAEFYTTQLMSGFLATMEKDSAGCLARERDALATPNSLSLVVTEALRTAGTHEAVRDTLTKIARLQEAG